MARGRDRPPKAGSRLTSLNALKSLLENNEIWNIETASQRTKSRTGGGGLDSGMMNSNIESSGIRWTFTA